MNDFYIRLLQVAEIKGFKSLNKFALEGLNYSSSEKLNRLKKENTNPSVDILLDISNMFEDISIEWLLTGKGNILQGSYNTVAGLNNNQNDLKEKLIEVLQNQNEDLRNDKELLQKDKIELQKDKELLQKDKELLHKLLDNNTNAGKEKSA